MSFEVQHQEVAFCGYCGRPAAAGERRDGERRICRCGFGFVLTAPAPDAPSPADAFLIVYPDQAIAAVSRRAERLLRISERDFVDRPLTRLLVPSDGASPDAVEAELAEAAEGRLRSGRRFRPVTALARILDVRIGRCGKPSAALLILEETG
jgi:hypothetical protein